MKRFLFRAAHLQIRIIDADNGAEAINCDMVTMRNITLEFTKDRRVGLARDRH